MQDAVVDVHCPPAAAMGLSSLSILCRADVLDFYKAWKVRPCKDACACTHFGHLHSVGDVLLQKQASACTLFEPWT